MNNGTGFLTLGIFTTILLFVNLALGATRDIENLRIGFDGFSETLLNSAEYKCSSSISSSSSSLMNFLTYNILSANFS